MDIHVQNASFQDIGLFENYESFIWTERYSAFGDFILVLPITDANRVLLSNAKYLAITSSTRTMRVETVEVDALSIKVTGRSIESLLDQRVIVDPGPTATSLIDYINKLILYNFGALAVVAERQVPYFYSPGYVPSGFTDPSTYTAIKYGDNLYSSVKNLCDGANLGFWMFNPIAAVYMQFGFLYGADRTVLNPILFSESIGNINTVSELTSDVSLKNVAVVNLPPWDGSLGIGDVYNINSGTVPSGIARREVWSDATALRRDTSFTAINKPARAASWGYQELSNHKSANAIDFTISSGNTYKYGVDYNLGDQVLAINSLGAHIPYRVMEYIQSFGPTGNSAYPTLTAI